MRKNKSYKAIIAVFICFVVLLFLLWERERSYSANSIFYKNVESIVELKASSTSQGNNYGTAVFVNDSGILVTNAHVVTYKRNGQLQIYDTLQIRLPIEEDYREVSIVKYDEDLDIAILQLNEVDFDIKTVCFGDSDRIDYGEKVFSIGNTMNSGISISEGIISTPNIEVEYNGIVREVIQADINISSGNSGGALLDEKGCLIGITSFRMKDQSGEVVYGIGFFVPINKVLDYMKQL